MWQAKQWYREKLAAMRTAETSSGNEPAQKDGDTGEATISEGPSQKDGDIHNLLGNYPVASEEGRREGPVRQQHPVTRKLRGKLRRILLLHLHLQRKRN